MYDRYTINDKIHINKGPTVYLQFNLRTLAFAGLDCQCRMWAYFDECPWEKCEMRSRRQWRKHESGRGTKSSASQLGRFGLRSLDFLFASRIFCFCVSCLDASEWQVATSHRKSTAESEYEKGSVFVRRGRVTWTILNPTMDSAIMEKLAQKNASAEDWRTGLQRLVLGRPDE